MRKPKPLNSNTNQFDFTKEEMQILGPLSQKRLDLDKSIQDFIGKKVMTSLPLDANNKYAVRFNIPQGWIKVKRMDTNQEVTQGNVRDVLGWEKPR